MIDNDFIMNVLLDGTIPGMERRVNTREINKDVASLENVMLLTVCIPAACLPSDLYDPLGVDMFCQTKNQNKVLDSGDIACL